MRKRLIIIFICLLFFVGCGLKDDNKIDDDIQKNETSDIIVSDDSNSKQIIIK